MSVAVFDDDALFYLMSRGIDADTASKGWTSDATCQGSVHCDCAVTISTVTAGLSKRSPTARDSVTRPTTTTRSGRWRPSH